MKVVQGLNNWKVTLPIGSVALGYFDGVHRGHQQIIATSIKEAHRQSLPSMVLSFEPHPLRVINPPKAPKLITSFTHKTKLLEGLGVDFFLVLPFTSAFAATKAPTFARDVLNKTLKTKHVTVGYNYTFGHKGEGTPEKLTIYGQELGFSVTVIPPITINGEVISSSLIRQLINQGDIANAAAALGRWPSISGRITRGAGRGRTLGFPTANILLNDNLLWPRFGVYAVRSWYQNQYLFGVANVGLAPTFSNNTARLEVYFFNFHENLYGKTMYVELIRFLRPEQKFSSSDELKQQIEIDKEQAWRIFTYAGTKAYQHCPPFVYNRGAL
ncbi:MAG: bifunctional riboflavin kinase/FAD synthetase [Firmicutes bacterium]|nr:bifunctional riboflavin kinase/FAD synthetase [Bacillota bacterium]